VPTPLRARKSLGQHWLTDRRVLARIVAAAEITPDDTVVEVGPGKGALTRLLVPRTSRLILIEVDRLLSARLRAEYAGSASIAIIEGDVLETPPDEVLNRGNGGVPYVILGNLPYFIGSAIVRHFLTAAVRPRRLVVTLQAEVAARMAAEPGRMSYLSVETQLLAEAELLFIVPASAFHPPPKVQSAVLRLDVRDSPDVEVDDRDRFLEVVRAGFAAPRKRLRNSLAAGLRVGNDEASAILEAAGIDAARRPQELTLDDWRDVYFGYRRHTAK
jgi:16S rRNA (adenine1518-N6/adenine1519-N6)-dimethyltransferase